MNPACLIVEALTAKYPSLTAKQIQTAAQAVLSSLEPTARIDMVQMGDLLEKKLRSMGVIA